MVATKRTPDGKDSLVYGQFALDENRVVEFVAWCIRRGYEEVRRLMFYLPDSREFGVAWLDLTDEIPASFQAWQYEFINGGK